MGIGQDIIEQFCWMNIMDDSRPACFSNLRISLPPPPISRSKEDLFPVSPSIQSSSPTSTHLSGIKIPMLERQSHEDAEKNGVPLGAISPSNVVQ